MDFNMDCNLRNKEMFIILCTIVHITAQGVCGRVVKVLDLSSRGLEFDSLSHVLKALSKC